MADPTHPHPQCFFLDPLLVRISFRTCEIIQRSIEVWGTNSDIQNTEILFYKLVLA